MADNRPPELRNSRLRMRAIAALKAPGAGKLAQRRRLGWLVGAFLSTAVMLLLLTPGQEHLRAPGTMNVGHEALSCDSCHQPAPGSIRQQLQANTRYLLGLRQAAADFGNQDVTNDDCLACHERPFDRHPVFRFNEPRFKQARQELGPHECQNCHGEHTGTKINVRANYCSSCHSELKLEKDPIDVPHSQLVADKRFDTCLGCHDFHGNHERSTQVKLSQAIPPQRIESYFAGAASPYGNALRAPPLKERANAAKK